MIKASGFYLKFPFNPLSALLPVSASDTVQLEKGRTGRAGRRGGFVGYRHNHRIRFGFCVFTFYINRLSACRTLRLRFLIFVRCFLLAKADCMNRQWFLGSGQPNRMRACRKNKTAEVCCKIRWYPADKRSSKSELPPALAGGHFPVYLVSSVSVVLHLILPIAIKIKRAGFVKGSSPSIRRNGQWSHLSLPLENSPERYDKNLQFYLKAPLCISVRRCEDSLSCFTLIVLLYFNFCAAVGNALSPNYHLGLRMHRVPVLFQVVLVRLCLL